jgi:hypothetical protein
MKVQLEEDGAVVGGWMGRLTSGITRVRKVGGIEKMGSSR